MSKERFLVWCDRTIVFAVSALVYFLPISIALNEIFTGIAIFFYLLKRVVVFATTPRSSGSKPDLAAGLFFASLKPKDNYLNLPMYFFVLVNFITVPLSLYPDVSWKGFVGKILENTFLFFAFVEAVNSRKRLKVFLTVFLVGITLLSIDGIYQYFVGKEFIHGLLMYDGRISASLRSHNDFAGYLVLVSPFVLALSVFCFSHIKLSFSKTNSIMGIPKVMTYWLGPLTILAVLCLILTFSRGAWIGFLVSLVVFFVLQPRLRLKIICLVAVVAVLGGGIVYKGARKDLQNVQTIFTSNGRSIYWQEAINIIKDYPILGVGVNAYSLVGRDYKIVWGGYPHNCYLQMAAETGFVGLGIFLWMMFTVFKNAFQNIRRLSDSFYIAVMVGALGGLAAFLTHGFWDTIFYSVQLSTLMWVFLGLIVVSEKISEEKI